MNRFWAYLSFHFLGYPVRPPAKWEGPANSIFPYWVVKRSLPSVAVISCPAVSINETWLIFFPPVGRGEIDTGWNGSLGWKFFVQFADSFWAVGVFVSLRFFPTSFGSTWSSWGFPWSKGSQPAPNFQHSRLLSDLLVHILVSGLHTAPQIWCLCLVLDTSRRILPLAILQFCHFAFAWLQSLILLPASTSFRPKILASHLKTRSSTSQGLGH